jgi:hypothetical protein
MTEIDGERWSHGQDLNLHNSHFADGRLVVRATVTMLTYLAQENFSVNNLFVCVF